MTSLELILPDWPLADKINVCTTTRCGGVSSGAYSELNLAHHVGDQISCVEANRELLQQHLGLPAVPKWLNQIHGTHVVDAQDLSSQSAEADAVYTNSVEHVCAVMTADCLPIVLCDENASCVVVIHAGWRGLIYGVIENAVTTLAKYCCPSHAWLGPAIGPTVFEVGNDVYKIYIQKNPHLAKCFVASCNDRWCLDIYAAARIALEGCKVNRIYGGDYCTFSDAKRFFSYRRDGATGRMATLAWLK